MSRPFVITVALGGLLLGSVLSAREAPPRRDRCRIVLITVDTFRDDAVGKVGSTAMPLLAARVPTGTRFTHAYSATSTTQPSIASTLTGLHPWTHGVSRNNLVLADRFLTLAEILESEGFETAAVVGSAPVSSVFGFSQGFGVFSDSFTHVQLPGSTGVAGQRYYSLADTITTEATEHLDRMRSHHRQFLWIHYFDPHAPYGDSREGATLRPMPLVREIVEGRIELDAGIREARRLYELDLQFLDVHLDRLLTRLMTDGLPGETHVVIVGDHGESFGEDGSMAHGRRLTRWQTHVPLIVFSPELEKGARGDVAGSVDVFSTVLALAGQKVPEGTAGRDLTNRPGDPTRAVGMRTTEKYKELRLDGVTYDLSYPEYYVAESGGVIFIGNGDVVADDSGRPVELPRKREMLLGTMREFHRQLTSTTAEALDSPEVIRALKSLGYLQN